METCKSPPFIQERKAATNEELPSGGPFVSGSLAGLSKRAHATLSPYYSMLCEDALALRAERRHFYFSVS